jgi:ferredoxin-NADP reductase
VTAIRRTPRPGEEIESDLVVTSKRLAAERVIALDLRAADGSVLPRWQPGAHIDLELNGGLVRQYSLCGDPQDRERWQLAVLRETSSRGGSRWVHDVLEVGATLRAIGPRNRFMFEPAARYLFIAGGVGITPIMPMAAAAERARAEWTLVYGGRSRTSMAYAAELSERYGDRVRLFPEDECGLLDLDVLVPDPDGSTLVYCCGPRGLLDAIERRASDWPKGDLRIERFAAVDPGTVADQPFEIELLSARRRLTVEAGQSVLDTLRRHGIEVPSSCEEGVCGTCLTRVLSGVVDHRDAVLSKEERSAHRIMALCVSRAANGPLVLDL